jgi:hypothetical protein
MLLGGSYLAAHAIACRGLGVRHLRSRPRRPQTNGKAEWLIRTLKVAEPTGHSTPQAQIDRARGLARRLRPSPCRSPRPSERRSPAYRARRRWTSCGAGSRSRHRVHARRHHRRRQALRRRPRHRRQSAAIPTPPRPHHGDRDPAYATQTVAYGSDGSPMRLLTAYGFKADAGEVPAGVLRRDFGHGES